MERDDDEVLPAPLVRCLLEAVGPVAPPAALRARVLAAVAPQAAADIVVVRRDEGQWRGIAPGVEEKLLHDDGCARTWLARMQPGAVFPPHAHPGHEECLVLEGTLEADGIAVAAGDYQIALRGSRHGTVSTATGCLLLLRTARF